MKRSGNNKKFIILMIAAALLIGFATVIITNYQTKTSFKYSKQTAEELKPNQHPQDLVNKTVNEEEAALDKSRKESQLLKILPSDIVLGDKNAPVLMIEYASLSCPHCSSFTRDAFEKFKAEYIDTNKVKFVYRDFPLNKQALVAGMFAICQAHDNKSDLVNKYYATLKILFKTQDNWAFDPQFEEKLEAIAKLDGMDSSRFKACLADQKLQEKILQHRIQAAKSLVLRSTPTFFINEKVTEGYVDYPSIKKIIEQELAKK